MPSMTTWIYLLAALALPSISFAEDLRWAVVHDTVAVNKQHSLSLGNVYPWLAPPPKSEDGLEAVVVSNSCGFVELTYAVESVASAAGAADGRKLRKEKFYYQMGEWCRLDVGLIESETLVR